ncbi:2-oxoglutarate (2OG) and Fe(II)-dependent oxygenase superfamily protein [Melia azedarach]|uniref:2-oxoglutarate (2OG) and Fe(II)-dependent oxygenase superfamily protein n=1 Tax=Melia azedarach TaxID=155640 RepID=A0ACC1XGY5_MELAZ|nr:2-oxoglutarate (2OG) and Fe(II)-dependent oxygenase superfamily protein [Melia azedarach]
MQAEQELEFIHKSCSTVGYRPNVFSTTLSHLVATNSSHFIIPFVPIRERLKEKVEEFFGCEYELVVEFTGLISWTKGASIGWHSDDNRHYLKQRDFTAVCYLNNYGEDFEGGLFNFQHGEPKTIAPVSGDVVIYTADNRNIHSVDEVTLGERLTLTLWFSRDSSHDEDAKLISLLSQNLLHGSDNASKLCLPLPASSNMYWFAPNQASHDELGFNICCARLNVLGYDIYFSDKISSFSDSSELLMEPLQLARADDLFYKEFANILQALQVVQFFHWKASELPSFTVEIAGKVLHLSQSQQKKISCLKSVFVKDHQLVETVFHPVTINEKEQRSFSWADFSAAVKVWEDYIHKLHKDIVSSLPYWRTHQSLFSIQFDGSLEETSVPGDIFKIIRKCEPKVSPTLM